MSGKGRDFENSEHGLQKPELPTDVEELRAALALEIQRRQDAEEEAERWKRVAEDAQDEARIDPKFKIPNYRAVIEEGVVLASILDRQEEGLLAVLMTDVRCLKELNDTFSHDVGNQAIQRSIDALEANLRIGDFMGRYDGAADELVVLIPTLSVVPSLGEGETDRVVEPGRQGTEHRLSASLTVIEGRLTEYLKAHPLDHPDVLHLPRESRVVGIRTAWTFLPSRSEPVPPDSAQEFYERIIIEAISEASRQLKKGSSRG